MRYGSAVIVALAVFAWPAAVRGDDMPVRLLPPVPVGGESRPVPTPDAPLPPVGRTAAREPAPGQNVMIPAHLLEGGSSRPEPERRTPDRPGDGRAARPASGRDSDRAKAVSTGRKKEPARSASGPPSRDDDLTSTGGLFPDERDEKGDRKRATPAGRTAGKLKDKVDDLFDDARGRRGWFQSDHAFGQFVSPITNPFLAEDPRALTELRPVFLYQKVPDGQPNFRGGNLWFVGGRGSLAFGERFSLTVNKVGGVAVNPGDTSLLDGEFGLAELWLGPKVTFYRDPDAGTVAAAGAVFQIPLGSGDVFQDTGRLSVAPYLSVGQEFLRSQFGAFTALATTGYSFGTDSERSDYFYASGSLAYDVGNLHRFYPMAELNWFQYTADGKGSGLGVEGRDVVNFGGRAKGAGLLTGALGARFKLGERWQLGGAFEIPLAGPRDLFRYRVTFDLTFRY